jgi:bifunctional UDP-N-acetylglucosamine pyrophosphorylase/glucosamine-1-phosphate N-acetyltransferase
MHAIAGLPMLAHALKQAQKAGCGPLCLVIAPGMHEVVATARELADDLRVATQTEALGTAHAVLSAKGELEGFQGNLLVLYADTPLVTAETMTRLNDALLRDAKCAIAVLGFTPANAGDYGRLVVANGTLEKIVEAKDASPAEKAIPLCNSGLMALRGSVAWEMLERIGNDNAKGEYYLTDIVALARRAGYIASVVEADAEEVLGVNSRAELAQAESIFQNRARAAHMAAGVTLLDPQSVYFSADTTIGADTLIEPHVFFGPGVAIGENCHIKAFSHIEGSVIAEGCVVGPYARLRPGTNLGENVKIGNFVEMKKAEVAAGAKINHLSYIGDAMVGEEANIGAGTITCNYDGFLKQRTIIGRDVFVGSNSALVAPVTIGDGAMIAAGSVVTEDVPADALAIARSRQEQKAAWAKGFRQKQKAKKKSSQSS